MDFSKLELMDDRVLIRIIPKRHLRTKRGIILPEAAGVRFDTGLVVSRGPGQITLNGVRVKPVLEPGDYVQFLKNLALVMNLDMDHPDREFAIIREPEISWKITGYIESNEENENLKPTSEQMVQTPRS